MGGVDFGSIRRPTQMGGVINTPRVWIILPMAENKIRPLKNRQTHTYQVLAECIYIFMYRFHCEKGSSVNHSRRGPFFHGVMVWCLAKEGQWQKEGWWPGWSHLAVYTRVRIGCGSSGPHGSYQNTNTYYNILPRIKVI